MGALQPAVMAVKAMNFSFPFCHRRRKRENQILARSRLNFFKAKSYFTHKNILYICAACGGMVGVMEIILASKSPRRREILEHMGLKVKVIDSKTDESSVFLSEPGELTERLSLIKAGAVLSEAGENSLIVASDTVVCAKGRILGKPRDRDNALDMLRLLSGATHSVVSGLAVIYNGHAVTAHETTLVKFRELTMKEIERYVDSGDPFDKAGGYGIQDSASVFIERIEGDYFNVVGLPVCRLFSVMRDSFGLDFFDIREPEPDR